MIKIEVKLDKKHKGTATTIRYIIGKPMDDISGAVYISNNIVAPDSILLTIRKDKDEQYT